MDNIQNYLDQVNRAFANYMSVDVPWASSPSNASLDMRVLELAVTVLSGHGPRTFKAWVEDELLVLLLERQLAYAKNMHFAKTKRLRPEAQEFQRNLVKRLLEYSNFLKGLDA